MAAWVVVSCLLTLRAEFDQLAPHRDKGADGTVGDLAHQQGGTSDHLPDEQTPALVAKDADHVNEVHALDIDATGPWPAGRSLDDSVEIIRLRHLRGHDTRLQNIVWRDRVASRSWGWTWEARPGIGHFDHAHFSAVYTSAQEADTRPWGLIEEDDMATAEEIATAVWAKPITSDWLKVDKRSAADWLKYADAGRRDVASTRADVQTIGKALLAAIAANAGTVDVDEDAIIAGVLAGISPEKIVALIPQSIAQEVVEQLAARIAS